MCLFRSRMEPKKSKQGAKHYLKETQVFLDREGPIKVENDSYTVVSLFLLRKGPRKGKLGEKELSSRKNHFLIENGTREGKVKGKKSLLIEKRAKERQVRGKRSSCGGKILF